MSSAAVPRTTVLLDCDGGASGAENMRRDMALLERCARRELQAAVRLYWFDPPCLSLGRLQPWSDADTEACARDGVQVVRRPSGGRAVLHADEVTYAVACRGDDATLGGTVLESCARIHAVIARGLALLGAELSSHVAPRETRRASLAAGTADCFTVPAAHELVDGLGRKLVGSAQHRRGDALLQHGSVLLRPSRAHLYLRSGGGGSGASLTDLLARPVSRQEVNVALAAAFDEALDTTA